MERRYTDLATVISKAPFHLSKRILEDFTRAQKNVELIKYEFYFSQAGRGREEFRVVGYDARGRSFTMVYPRQPVMRSEIDERG